MEEWAASRSLAVAERLDEPAACASAAAAIAVAGAFAGTGHLRLRRTARRPPVGGPPSR